MDTTQLILAVRESATLGDASAFPEYTDARILRELNDKLRTVFEDLVTKSRSGYWVHRYTFTTTPNLSRYRIPPRAVVQGLEDVQLSPIGSTTNYVSLDQVPVSDFARWEAQVGTQPVVYCCSGDQVEFAPPVTAALPVKFLYYIRPSQMYTAQNSVSGTDRGRITAFNAVARTVTVNAIPFDMSQFIPAAVTSGQQLIDIVHADGWHELAMVDITQTFTGLVFTLAGTANMDRVQVGDYVRVRDQTDWPCLPDDFNRCLADAAAVKILIELHLSEKSELLGANNSNDIARFRSLLYPRVKAAPRMIGIRPKARGSAWPFGRTWT